MRLSSETVSISETDIRSEIARKIGSANHFSIPQNVDFVRNSFPIFRENQRSIRIIAHMLSASN